MRTTELVDLMYKEANLKARAIESGIGAAVGGGIGAAYGDSYGKAYYPADSGKKRAKHILKGMAIGAGIGAVGGPAVELGSKKMYDSEEVRDIGEMNDYLKRKAEGLHQSMKNNSTVTEEARKMFSDKYMNRDYASEFKRHTNSKDKAFSNFKNMADMSGHWENVNTRDRIHQEMKSDFDNWAPGGRGHDWDDFYKTWRNYGFGGYGGGGYGNYGFGGYGGYGYGRSSYNRSNYSAPKKVDTDPHTILKGYGVDASKVKTKAEVNDLRRKLSKQYHPDVNKAPDATEKMQQVNSHFDSIQKTPWYEKLSWLYDMMCGMEKTGSTRWAREFTKAVENNTPESAQKADAIYKKMVKFGDNPNATKKEMYSLKRKGGHRLLHEAWHGDLFSNADTVKAFPLEVSQLVPQSHKLQRLIDKNKNGELYHKEHWDMMDKIDAYLKEHFEGDKPKGDK